MNLNGTESPNKWTMRCFTIASSEVMDGAEIIGVFGHTMARRLVEYQNNLVDLLERDRAQLLAENQMLDGCIARLSAERDSLKSDPCPECGGTGGIDSGGVTPWGAGIMLPCPSCSQNAMKPKVLNCEGEESTAAANSDAIFSVDVTALKRELSALRARNDALTKALEDAPHTIGCIAKKEFNPGIGCTCWKSRALGKEAGK